MGRRARAALTAGAVMAGSAAGFLAERRVLRSRLAAPPPSPGPPLGSIAGDRCELDGPDGVRVLVETYGPDTPVDDGADRPPTLVLVHGWTMTGRIWHEQVAGLADRHRIVTYDQPGHGRSSPPRSGTYSIDLLGDTLAAVVDATTAPDGPVVVAGHSLGGMTVLNAVRRHPDLAARIRAVALLSTTSGSGSGDGLRLGLGVHSLARIEGPLRRLGQRLPAPLGRLARAAPTFAETAATRFYTASSDLSFALTRFVALAPDSDPRHVDFTEQLALDSDLGMIRALTAPVLGLDEDEGLACLPVPTVIVTGGRDHLVSPHQSRRMADRCPHAELLVLPGIGHMTLLEAHDEVNAVLARLVRARPGATDVTTAASAAVDAALQGPAVERRAGDGARVGVTSTGRTG